MSKLLRFLESLRKSNGKNWFQIWKLLLIKDVKSLRIFFFVFSANFALLEGFFIHGIDAPIHISQKRHCVLYAGFFLKVSSQANIRNMFFDQPLVSQTPRSGCFAQTQTHTRTSRLYNWLGQEGSFSENISCCKNKYILCTKMPCKMHIIVWPKC